MSAVANMGDVARTVAILGGRGTLAAPVTTAMEAHDLILRGLPAAALEAVVAVAESLTSAATIESVLGISARTFQRRMRDREPLSPEQSGRLWKFAEILGRARAIFGSEEAAEEWLTRPAIGLDERRPIELLATPVGMTAVEDYLTRIEYGVYT